jgi:hypothetical protein
MNEKAVDNKAVTLLDKTDEEITGMHYLEQLKEPNLETGDYLLILILKDEGNDQIYCSKRLHKLSLRW